VADGFRITAETRGLIDAIDRLGPRVEELCAQAAQVTADNIVREARARLARATSGHGTGLTMKGIVRSPGANRGAGWAVLSSRQHPLISWHTMKKTGRSHTQAVTQSNVPIWLEMGTRYMAPRPYFFVSADLEADAHDRRMREAIQRAIDEVNR